MNDLSYPAAVGHLQAVASCAAIDIEAIVRNTTMDALVKKDLLDIARKLRAAVAEAEALTNSKATATPLAAMLSDRTQWPTVRALIKSEQIPEQRLSEIAREHPEFWDTCIVEDQRAVSHKGIPSCA